MVPVIILLFMVHYTSCTARPHTDERLDANAFAAHQDLLLAGIDLVKHVMRIEVSVLFVEAHRRVFLSSKDLNLVDFAKLLERLD